MTTPILGAPGATLAAAAAWARSRGATDEFVGLAAYYWTLAPQRGGVRPDVAYAESAKETGLGHFGGTDAAFSASSDMHNPAGLKTTDGSATARFASWALGVTAHLDHLALYAGAPGYPRADSPDPRHFPAIRGVCPTVEGLGGHYAPDPNYGVSIVADYLEPMEAVTMTTETWCPFATIERGPYDGGAHGGPIATPVLGNVEHVTTNWADPGPFFARAINGASSTFWIRRDGELVQYLPLEVRSWAQSEGNADYWSTETDGTVDVELSPAQVATFGRLQAWLATQRAVPVAFGPADIANAVGEHGLGWHGMGGAAWGGHTGCPGDLRRAQRPAIAAAAHGAPGGSTPSQPMEDDMAYPSAHDPVTGGQWVITPDGGAQTYDGAPYIGSLNTHPEWHADKAVAADAWLADPSSTGVDGRTGAGLRIITACDAHGLTHAYRFRRDGSDIHPAPA